MRHLNNTVEGRDHRDICELLGDKFDVGWKCWNSGVIKGITLKMLMITYKAVHGCAPSYIADLIEQYTAPQKLQSSNELRLQPPRIMSRTKFYGDRSFSYAAAHLWNSLPNSLRQADSMDTFKSLLKTNLFSKWMKSYTAADGVFLDIYSFTY